MLFSFSPNEKIMQQTVAFYTILDYIDMLTFQIWLILSYSNFHKAARVYVVFTLFMLHVCSFRSLFRTREGFVMYRQQVKDWRHTVDTEMSPQKWLLIALKSFQNNEESRNKPKSCYTWMRWNNHLGGLFWHKMMQHVLRSSTGGTTGWWSLTPNVHCLYLYCFFYKERENFRLTCHHCL